MGKVVAKFGGSSLRYGRRVERSARIVEERGIPYVVVSAAGGITDMLLSMHGKKRVVRTWRRIAARYRSIAGKLGVSKKVDIERDLGLLLRVAQEGVSSRCYLAHFGERIMAKIMAARLGYEFIDAADVIKLDEHGEVDFEKTQLNAYRLSGAVLGYVIPGFYGEMPDYSIRTFSRGGSDYTGSVIARIVRAERYENWTDVSGIRMTDPKVVPHAKLISFVTYSEMVELACRGAKVLHEKTVLPLIEVRIPIHLCNTTAPHEPGTWIVPDDWELKRDSGVIAGFAGKRGYTAVSIQKSLMLHEKGLAYRMTRVYHELDINIEQFQDRGSRLSAIVQSEELIGKLDALTEGLKESCDPERVDVVQGLALVCIVGQGMVHSLGMAARVTGTASRAGINIRAINQDDSEIVIIIAIDERDLDKMMFALHKEFA